MGIEVKHFAVGPLETNSFVISNDKDGVLIIDLPPHCDKIIDYLQAKALSPVAILLTHAHFDHMMGIQQLHEKFGDVPVYAHPDEKLLLQNPEFNGSPLMGTPYAYSGPTNDLAEGFTTIGGISFTVLKVSGHSPGGCAFLFENLCFVGDTLFAGSVGRTDFPGCDGPALLKNIKEKIFTLPEDTIIYPGHGTSTTVGREKRTNPFF